MNDVYDELEKAMELEEKTAVLNEAAEVEAQDVGKMFKDAVVLVLRRSCWGNVKKIPKETIESMTEGKVKEMVRATKDLIDKKHLQDFMYCFNKALAIKNSYGTPIPGLEGMVLVKKTIAQKVAKELDEIIKKSEEAIQEIKERYAEYREAARPVLEAQGLFNPADYPATIHDKFGISYNFLSIGVSEEIKQFDPNFYAQEQAKWADLMTNARAEAIVFWRDTLQQMLSDTVELLKGEKKQIRQSRIEQFEKLGELFKERKIFNDEDLLKLIEMCKDTMRGVDAARLRDSSVMKQEKATQLQKIKEILTANTEQMRRKITLE